jgi:hypothetical protein
MTNMREETLLGNDGIGMKRLCENDKYAINAGSLPLLAVQAMFLISGAANLQGCGAFG